MDMDVQITIMLHTYILYRIIFDARKGSTIAKKYLLRKDAKLVSNNSEVWD